MRQTDVLIIGGGAAGLTAAIAAARNGASVIVLEHTERIGRKLLSTGNGRCNYTNADMKPEYFRGSGQFLAADLLRSYDTETIVNFFRELGIEPAERSGYYYPASGQAASVFEVLRMECARLKVGMVMAAEPERVYKTADIFELVYRQDGKKKKLCSRTLILATGSKASPVTGSDGSGYDLAGQFGHRIVPVYPALTALRTEGSFLKAWAGVRVRGKAALWIEGKQIAADGGELQLTDYGVSGIPVFQISRYAAQALGNRQHIELSLAFLPEYWETDPQGFLRERFAVLCERKLLQALIGLLPAKLIPVVIRYAGLSAEQECRLSPAQLERLTLALTDFRLTVTGTGSFAQAQVCAGGADGRQIRSGTMESALCEGLYFAGELIDVDGICGGYNLHFAWASGLAAGKNAALAAVSRGKERSNSSF